MPQKTTKEKILEYIDDANFEIIPYSYGLDRQKKERKISYYGLYASTINDTKPILKRSQLLQCVDAYMNDGTVRAMVNKRVDFILGNRPKYLIEPAFKPDMMTKEEQQSLEVIMSSQEIIQLKRKFDRVNKRVSFHEKITNLVTQNFILGRSAGGIERKKHKYGFGEPTSLKVLNGLRLKNPIINEDNWELEGINYDFGGDKNNEPIEINKLLPMWYNDHNLYDNTLYTGMSPVWSILSIAQANTYINDEDIPESCKSLWAKYGFIYVGDKNPDSMTKFRENAKVGTLFFHNNKDLEPKLADLKNDLSELTDVRMANMKAMCINFGFPMFLLFEDTANFATAVQVMQAYKSGVLERDRTWLRGFLERYWYDPMLADSLGLTRIDDVNDQLIKCKAAFDDIVFETRKDIVDSDIPLLEQGVLMPLDVAKDIQAKPEVIERLSKLNEDELTRIWLEGKRKEATQKVTIA